MLDTVEIERLARAFRVALELAPPQLPEEFRDFPAGTCGDVADLLGTFLIESGMPTFRYASGTRGEHELRTYTTHAWLELDGLIVDITADQFVEVSQPVIVTNKSAWHSSFRVTYRRTAGFRGWEWDSETVSRLSAVYAAVLALVQSVPITARPDASTR